ncbi:phosphotransferase family protein [Porticoccus sp. GXU_MW_L64]
MSDFTFDIQTLGGYLEEAIPEFQGPLTAEKFAGGQSNPTFLITTPKQRYVLRRKPPGELLKSAHAVDREYRVMKALETTDVPVPHMVHLCTDESVIGSIFYVMEYVEGRVMWDPSLPEASAEERTAIYREMSRVLASLHSVDIDAVGLSDYGRPGNYYERQIGRWTKQYRASETEHIASMEKLIDWLPANMPEDDGHTSLVHGDFRLDNMLFDANAANVLAVLDWELSTLGHPFADLAYQCMQLRMAHDSVMPGLGGIDRAELGIPSEQEYVSWYCQARNIEAIPNWNFYLIFSFFRFAAILQGVKKRALDGNASSSKALEMGELTRPLTEMAAQLC